MSQLARFVGRAAVAAGLGLAVVAAGSAYAGAHTTALHVSSVSDACSKPDHLVLHVKLTHAQKHGDYTIQAKIASPPTYGQVDITTKGSTTFTHKEASLMSGDAPTKKATVGFVLYHDGKSSSFKEPGGKMTSKLPHCTK